MASLPSPCPCNPTLPSHVSHLAYSAFWFLAHIRRVQQQDMDKLVWLVSLLISRDYDNPLLCVTAETITHLRTHSLAPPSAPPPLAPARHPHPVLPYQAKEQSVRGTGRWRQIGGRLQRFDWIHSGIPFPDDPQQSLEKRERYIDREKKEIRRKKEICAWNSPIHPLRFLKQSIQPSQFTTVSGRLSLAGLRCACAVLCCAVRCCAVLCWACAGLG